MVRPAAGTVVLIKLDDGSYAVGVVDGQSFKGACEDLLILETSNGHSEYALEHVHSWVSMDALEWLLDD